MCHLISNHDIFWEVYDRSANAPSNAALNLARKFDAENFYETEILPGDHPAIPLPWNTTKGAWDVEPDHLTIILGGSSADIQLKKTITVGQ